MYYSVDIVLFKYLRYCILVADVCLNKCVIISVLDILKILKVTCVCKLVNIDNTNFIIVLSEHIMNVVTSNETCSTCYQISSHNTILSLLIIYLPYSLGRNILRYMLPIKLISFLISTLRLTCHGDRFKSEAYFSTSIRCSLI